MDKQIGDALDEILRAKSCDDMKEEDNNLDKKIDEALEEILAPSPRAQPHAPSTKISRKELIKTVQMNLDNIKDKNKEIEDEKNDIIELTKDIQSDDDIIINKSNGNKHKYENKIPSNFICPISKTIMSEAVMASDGRIYDKINIENWLKDNDTSPISQQKLRHKMLMPFNELTDKINYWKMKNSVKKRRKKKRRSSSLKKKKIKDVSVNNILVSLSPISPLSPLSPNDEHNETKNVNLEIGIDSSDTS